MRARTHILGLLLLTTLLGLSIDAVRSDVPLRLTQALDDQSDMTPLLTADRSRPVSVILEVEFNCEADETLSSLFVSIADTAIAAEEAVSPQRVLLKIEAGQLDAIRTSAHCEGAGPRFLREAVTAYGSVSCSNEQGRVRSETVSTPIDLWYDCPGADKRGRMGAADLQDE
ncbi:MAG: hypothetical protein QNJ73_09500 [Gammaproteobacteria bacterium]|nr:hypothetical protein [Gammaproteobacteria bacterium]